MAVESLIDMGEKVIHKHYGIIPDTEYFPANFIQVNGEVLSAVFTHHQIINAIDEAKPNQNSLEKIKWLKKIFDF